MALPLIIADWETSLTAKIAVGGTTGTIASNVDDDGVTIADGTVYLTVDGNNSAKEHIRCTKTGTALSAIYSYSRQGVATSGTVREHRVGAKVIMTDYATYKNYFEASQASAVLNPSETSTDNAIARFDGTTGKLLQNSSILIGDDGAYARFGASDANDADVLVHRVYSGASQGADGTLIYSVLAHPSATRGSRYIILASGDSADNLPIVLQASTLELTKYKNGGAGVSAILNYDNITSSSKTFTFPNRTGTLAVYNVTTTTDDATAVIDVDATDTYELSAVANATTFSTTGTPRDGQRLIIRFKDAGVAKGLTWDAAFVAIGVTLPTTTVAGKWHYVGCQYNSAASKWHALAVGVQA